MSADARSSASRSFPPPIFENDKLDEALDLALILVAPLKRRQSFNAT